MKLQEEQQLETIARALRGDSYMSNLARELNNGKDVFSAAQMRAILEDYGIPIDTESARALNNHLLDAKKDGTIDTEVKKIRKAAKHVIHLDSINADLDLFHWLHMAKKIPTSKSDIQDIIEKYGWRKIIPTTLAVSAIIYLVGESFYQIYNWTPESEEDNNTPTASPGRDTEKSYHPGFDEISGPNGAVMLKDRKTGALRRYFTARSERYSPLQDLSALMRQEGKPFSQSFANVNIQDCIGVPVGTPMGLEFNDTNGNHVRDSNETAKCVAQTPQ